MHNLGKYLETNWNEAEIRFNLSQEKIRELLESQKSTGKIITSVVLSYGDLRRESFYESGVKTHHVDQRKSSLGHVQTKDFKIVFSLEEPAVFDLHKKDLIRAKYRISFDFPAWRMDFTRAKIITSQQNLLAALQKFWSSNEGEWQLEIEFHREALGDGEIVIHEAINSVLSTTCEGDLFAFYKILGKIPHPSVKNLVNNPIILTRGEFTSIDLSKYIVMDKSDGQRCLLYFTPDKVEEYTEAGCRVLNIAVNCGTKLVDCELVNDVYLLFDLLIDGGEVARGNFLERRATLESQLRGKLPKNMRLKPFLLATPENIREVFYKKYDHEIDGLIFNEIDASYKFAKIWKWKPAELITIDFLIVPFPFKGVKPFISDKNIYILMCGCEAKKFASTGIKLFSKYEKLMQLHGLPTWGYRPVPFSPSVNRDLYIYETLEDIPLSVGEFQWTTKGWKLIKLRPDRKVSEGFYGNNFFVAEKHFHEIQFPLTFEELLKNGKTGGSYFERSKTAEYSDMTKFNRYVKYRIMQRLRGARVLDIASGKGQDIYIYNSIGAAEVIFTEPDQAAVIELTDRSYNIDNPRAYKDIPRPTRNMVTKIIHSKFEDLVPQRVDAVVCNFALHYLPIPKFVDFCAATKAELVILTFFDSELVDRETVDSPKYKIIRRGDTYIVKHHFHDEPIPEAVVNTEHLIWLFRKKKYDLVARDSFGRYLSDRALSPEDAKYCSLYQYCIFKLR